MEASIQKLKISKGMSDTRCQKDILTDESPKGPPEQGLARKCGTEMNVTQVSADKTGEQASASIMLGNMGIWVHLYCCLSNSLDVIESKP